MWKIIPNSDFFTSDAHTCSWGCWPADKSAISPISKFYIRGHSAARELCSSMATTTGIPGTGRKILFEILSHIDPNAAGPRLGRLSIPGRRDLETPNFFAITSRGVVPHLTPDVIASHTKIGGVHIALEDCEYEITCIVNSSNTQSLSCRKSSEWHTADNELPWFFAPSYIYSTSKSIAKFTCTTSHSSSLCSEWQ